MNMHPTTLNVKAVMDRRPKSRSIKTSRKINTPENEDDKRPKSSKSS